MFRVNSADREVLREFWGWVLADRARLIRLILIVGTVLACAGGLVLEMVAIALGWI